MVQHSHKWVKADTNDRGRWRWKMCLPKAAAHNTRNLFYDIHLESIFSLLFPRANLYKLHLPSSGCIPLFPYLLQQKECGLSVKHCVYDTMWCPTISTTETDRSVHVSCKSNQCAAFTITKNLCAYVYLYVRFPTLVTSRFSAQPLQPPCTYHSTWLYSWLSTHNVTLICALIHVKITMDQTNTLSLLLIPTMCISILLHAKLGALISLRPE